MGTSRLNSHHHKRLSEQYKAACRRLISPAMVWMYTSKSCCFPTSYAAHLPLCSWSNHTRTNNTRQLLTSHAIQHTNTTHHHSREEDSKTRKQEEFGAHIFLLAGIATPFCALGASIFVCPCDRAVAGTRVALSVDFLAVAVA